MEKRNTKQKKLVEEEIKKIKTFFDAEELHSIISKRDKNIGIATVYRFLKKVSEEGKIHSYICNRKIIYSTNNSSHCHFTCKKCGNKRHISIESLDFLKKEIKEDICHFQVDITGLCEKCAKKLN